MPASLFLCLCSWCGKVPVQCRIIKPGPVEEASGERVPAYIKVGLPGIVLFLLLGEANKDRSAFET